MGGSFHFEVFVEVISNRSGSHLELFLVQQLSLERNYSRMAGDSVLHTKCSQKDPTVGIVSHNLSENKAALPNKQTDECEYKKERKPRRERLQFPDPIPEKFVIRCAEPSKAEMQTRVDVEDAKLQLCFYRLNSSRAFYESRQEIRDAGKPAFDNARAIFTELNDRCRQLFDERKLLSAKVKAIKEEDVAARAASASLSKDVPGAGKDGNEALRGVRTIEDLRQRIAALQYSQETESFSISEERKLVQQISFLHHKGRDFILNRDASFKNEQAAKLARIDTRSNLETACNVLDSTIDAAKDQLGLQKQAVDDIRAEQDKQIRELEEKTPKIDRDAEKRKIGEIKSHIRSMRDEFKNKLDKWYLNERIFFEQQKIAKRKKYEAQQAERQARRKAWEDEQAQYPDPHPYQEEIDMCSGLTVYLKMLLGEAIIEPSNDFLQSGSGPSLKPSVNARVIPTRGKTIGKSNTKGSDGFENLAFSNFVKKVGMPKNRKGRGRAVLNEDSAAHEDNPLKAHPIDYLTAFTRLGIKPPTRFGEVRAAFDAVKRKESYYQTAPARSEKNSHDEKANSQPKERVVSDSSSIANLGSDDNIAAAFPGLGSDAATPISKRNVNLPSFMAVTKGEAPVPNTGGSGSVVISPDICIGIEHKTMDDVGAPDSDEKACIGNELKETVQTDV